MATQPGTDLTDRLALVTGSSRGLGAATARRLAAAGADVIVTYRRQQEAAEAVAADVRATGRRAWVRDLNLADVADVDRLFDWIAAEHEGLDILVANAAQTKFADLMAVETRHVERTLTITVTSFLRMVQRAVPLFEQRGGGRVVAVSGADTQTFIPAHGLLGAAKAAMETMVRYLACELGARDVTVIGVCPGFIAGDSIRQMLGPFYEAAVAGEARSHPMGVATTPEHVAETVVLLCSDAARWINGDTVMADGAGVFAFCGRYIDTSAKVASLQGKVEGDGPAPSVRGG